ncbi:MAG: hypothetical protein ABIP54_02080 [Candidatus Andersenbacteria bacterium]
MNDEKVNGKNKLLNLIKGYANANPDSTAAKAIANVIKKKEDEVFKELEKINE